MGGEGQVRGEGEGGGGGAVDIHPSKTTSHSLSV